MSGAVEILPPEKVVTTAVALSPRAVGAYRPPNVSPGSPIPSGRWWVHIAGRLGQHTQLWLNGQEYQWPRGQWFVLEDKYFHVLMETDLPMDWYDGYDLMTKQIDQTPKGVKITPRLITRGRADPVSLTAPG